MNSIVSSGLKYFLRFILLYILLTGLSLIPAVGSAFNVMFRTSAEKGLTVIFPKAYIKAKGDRENPDLLRFEFASKAKVKEMSKKNRQGANNKAFQIPGKIYDFKFYNLFLTFYVFLITLILLAPLPRKEILLNLLIGTILFYGYSFFKAALTLYALFIKPETAIYQPSTGWINFWEKVLYFQTLGVAVLVVILIWALLVFRRGNWKKVFS